MLKGYQVEVVIVDNKNFKCDKFLYQRRTNFKSCKDCYDNCYKFLMNNPEQFLNKAGQMLGDFMFDKFRLSSSCNLQERTELYVFNVIFTCL